MDEAVDALRRRSGRAARSPRAAGRPRSSIPKRMRVVDVVVDVGDAVDDADDLPLERVRLAVAGVREDAVADLVRQVQPRAIRYDCSLWRNAEPEALAEHLVERVLARVAERRVAHVVPEPDRLGQVLVQPQRAGDDARDRGRLQRVRHARAVVVALRVDEDLRLALQAPERLRVDDPVAVALERRADGARLLRRARARASRTSARRAARARSPRARARAPRTRRQLSRPARASRPA